MSPFYTLTIAPILINIFLLAELFDITKGNYFSLFLFLPFLIYHLVSYFALLYWGNPDQSNLLSEDKFRAEGWNPAKLLIVTYVSVGKNIDTLEHTISESVKILESLKINYLVEVVTENELSFSNLIKSNKINLIKVPEDFETPEKTKFKARACEYARILREKEQSSLDQKWILHLDEESILTPSAVMGIHDFINTPETSNVIGQGEIKYNAKNYGKHLLPTVMDTMRTCHDLGYFRIQYKFLKAPLLGMHGSYLLIPANIENQIGFDCGPKASITEDLFFGLKAFQNGYSFGWINGFIREQSPLNIWDVVKQRRRWINGITLILFDFRIKFSYRLAILISLGLWRISQLMFSVLLILILLSWENPQIYLFSLILVTFAAFQYLIGAYCNIQFLKWTRIQRLTFYLKTLFLTPLCLVIESFCLLYALIFPSQQFYVVEKS